MLVMAYFSTISAFVAILYPVVLSHLRLHRGKYLLSRRQKVSSLFHPTLTLKTEESDFESPKKNLEE